MLNHPYLTELIFEVIQGAKGGYTASCLNAEINTKAVNLEELHSNLTDAIDDHFGDRPKPEPDEVHLLLFKDDALVEA